MVGHTVITGGPSTGKTTLINYLEREGHAVSDEAARALIGRGLGGELIPLPWEDLAGFERLLHRTQVVKEDAAPEGAFLDRSLVDIVAYCDAYNIPHPAGLMESIETRNYGPMFVLARLPVFETEAVRSEQDVEGHRLGAALMWTYHRLGFIVHEVPAFDGVGNTMDERVNDSVRKRAEYILNAREPEQGEIEIKARTEDIERVRTTLAGYPCTSNIVDEVDRYLPVDVGSHRIRERTYPDGTKRYFETRKGIRKPGAVNKRSEDEHEVFGDEITDLLSREAVVCVQKRREGYRPRFSPGVLITIDNVRDLGYFVEIEAPNEYASRQWAGRLLLPEMNWVQGSYETMLREKKNVL